MFNFHWIYEVLSEFNCLPRSFTSRISFSMSNSNLSMKKVNVGGTGLVFVYKNKQYSMK